MTNAIISTLDITQEIGDELDEGFARFMSEWEIWRRQLNTEILTVLLIALALLLLLLAFRKPLARTLLRIFYRTKRNTWSAEMRGSKHDLVSPLSWLLVGIGGVIFVETAHLPLSFGIFLGRLMQTVVISMLFVLLYQASKLIGMMVYERHDARLQQLVDAEETPLDTMRLTQTASRYLGTFIRAIIVVIGAVTILSIWIPDITAILAGVGIGGLVLALAAQDTAANVFASIAIMLDHPFRIGDWIETEEASGSVEHIGLRSTRIRAADQSLITVPNSTLGSIAIVNGTTRQTRNIIKDIKIDLETQTESAEEWVDTLRRIIPSIEGVVPDSNMVHITNIADTGITIGIRYKTDSAFAEMLRVQQEVNLAIMRSADQRGINFAATPLRVHINEAAKADQSEVSPLLHPDHQPSDLYLQERSDPESESPTEEH